MNWRIIILVGIALAAMLLATGGVGAQVSPPDCPDGQRRAEAGNITSPCVTPWKAVPIGLAHRFIPVSHISLEKTYCDMAVVLTLEEGWVLPSDGITVSRGWAHNWRGEHAVLVTDGGLVLRQRDIPVDESAMSVWHHHLEGEVSFVLNISSPNEHVGQHDNTPGPVTVRLSHRLNQWDGDNEFNLTMPPEEYYGWETAALKCQTEAYQGHLTLKHAAAEAQREADQAAQNAIAEATASAEEERARVTAETSARIDADRLESEKRVTATEAREIAVVEEMIQASIRIAAEITQVRIDRATARLESLERTATWLRDAAATDLDEWNTFYREVEQKTIARIEALQFEAAEKLAEVQQIQDNLAADLAASVARQQALTLQLQSQGGVSVDDLRLLRQNAVDWLTTLDGLIEEAESGPADE